MNAKDLVFLKKGMFPSKLTEDIVVSVHSNGYIGFSISPEAFYFLDKPEYLTAAWHGRRLYLKGTDASYGFKVQAVKNSSRRYINFPPTLVPQHISARAIEGSYKQQIDRECGLSYIELA